MRANEFGVREDGNRLADRVMVIGPIKTAAQWPFLVISMRSCVVLASSTSFDNGELSVDWEESSRRDQGGRSQRVILLKSDDTDASPSLQHQDDGTAYIQHYKLLCYMHGTTCYKNR